MYPILSLYTENDSCFANNLEKFITQQQQKTFSTDIVRIYMRHVYFFRRKAYFKENNQPHCFQQ